MIFAENKVTLDPTNKINKTFKPFDFHQQIYSNADNKKKRYEFYKNKVPELINFINKCISEDQVFT